MSHANADYYGIDDSTKVRLVRDRLYVNDEEVKPNKPDNMNRNQSAPWKSGPKRTEHYKNNQGLEIRSRTVYAKRKPRPQQTYQRPSTVTESSYKPPLIDWQNKYSALSDMRLDGSDTGSIRKSTKNKASSTVDRDLNTKKHKEGESEHVDTENEYGEQMITDDLNENQNGDQSDISDINPGNNSEGNPGDNSDGNSGNVSDSGSYVQNPSKTSSAEPNTPKPETEPIQTPGVAPKDKTQQTPDTIPNRTVRMPAYHEISNDLYYGPTVVTQPVASPPLGSTGGLHINPQAVLSQHSDPLNRDADSNII